MSGPGERQDWSPPIADAPKRSAGRRALGRGVDVTVAVLVLVVTLPISVIAAVAVKATSRGPLLTKDVCVGAGGRRFEMLTFRTTDAAGGRTRVGRVLHATSIDELPRWWNVLRGDMSIVGPRPTDPTGGARTSSDRSDAPPGMTGMWRTTGR